MRKIFRTISRPGFVRSLSLAAAAALLLSAAPQRTRAMSLITPGAAPAAKTSSDALTEVRGGHGGGGHGGGGFHGGGFHGGGFHGGGFHGGFHGGGWHGGGWHGGGWHGGWHGHRFGHFHHRRFFYGGGYYPSYYGYYHRPYCRVIWTYYGPRRICGWHHRRHYW